MRPPRHEERTLLKPAVADLSTPPPAPKPFRSDLPTPSPAPQPVPCPRRETPNGQHEPVVVHRINSTDDGTDSDKEREAKKRARDLKCAERTAQVLCERQNSKERQIC